MAYRCGGEGCREAVEEAWYCCKINHSISWWFSAMVDLHLALIRSIRLFGDVFASLEANLRKALCRCTGLIDLLSIVWLTGRRIMVVGHILQMRQARKSCVVDGDVSCLPSPSLSLRIQ